MVLSTADKAMHVVGEVTSGSTPNLSVRGMERNSVGGGGGTKGPPARFVVDVGLTKMVGV